MNADGDEVGVLFVRNPSALMHDALGVRPSAYVLRWTIGSPSTVLTKVSFQEAKYRKTREQSDAVANLASYMYVIDAEAWLARCRDFHTP